MGQKPAGSWFAPLVGFTVSSVPGIISPMSGSVIVLGMVGGVVVGIVVGGTVVMGTVAVVLGTVVAGVSALRHPVSTHRVRTKANGRMMNFFILKPPEFSDFKASISKHPSFKLGTFVEVTGFCHIFIKKRFLALLFSSASSIIFEK